MSSNSNMENLSPAVIRALTRELYQLTQSPPEGVRVTLNESDVTEIQASIEGPAGTPFAGGLFRIRLVLGKDYPQSAPRAYFLTKVFHPNVHPTSGEVCVNTLKRDWTPDTGIGRILLTIKCLLIAPNPESALNEEAGRLLLEEYDAYERRAKMMTSIHAISINSAIGKKDVTSDSDSVPNPAEGGVNPNSPSSNPSSLKRAPPTVASAQQPQQPKKQQLQSKLQKEKKRALKRL